VAYCAGGSLLTVAGPCGIYTRFPFHSPKRRAPQGVSKLAHDFALVNLDSRKFVGPVKMGACALEKQEQKVRSMTLEFVQREQEGIMIVDLKGPLTFGLADAHFRSELDKRVLAKQVRVGLNLDHVTEIDTTGLGTLLFALAKLQKAGGGLALVDLKPLHIEVVLEAKLAAVFEIFKTDQDAINSFFPDREARRYDILQFVRSQEEAAQS
jgi:anti-sigma B factor antagonist